LALESFYRSVSTVCGAPKVWSRNTFSSAVNQRLQTLGVFHVNHSDQGGVNPAASLDAVKAANDDLELHIVVLILILDLADEGSNFDTLNSLFHKGSSDFGLGLADISLAKEKLSVKIGDVNGICSQVLETL
jgi:hypothetical protein